MALYFTSANNAWGYWHLLWITDNGEPGSSDTIGIQVLSRDGGTWFTSNWDGTRTMEQILGGGNIAVH